MAKVKLNPLFQEIHGKVGDLVFRRTPSGGTIVYEAPKKSRGNTRYAQKVQQHHMGEAHAYARAAMADPERKARFEEQGKKEKKSAYLMALSRYWKERREIDK
jgi:hypothetical protein